MWLCSNCEKVPDEVISLIGQFCDFRVHWYCKICDKPAVHAVRSYSHMSNSFREDIMNSINKTMVESLSKVVESMTQAINKVEESVINHCKSLDEKLTSKPTTEAVDSGRDDIPNGTTHSSIDTITVGVVDEQRDQDKRKLNLILHNINESDKQDGPSRKADDIAYITALLRDHVGIAPTVTNAFRLGKRSDRPRLLKISVSSIDEKSSILRQCHKLRNSDNPVDIQKIFLRPI